MHTLEELYRLWLKQVAMKSSNQSIVQEVKEAAAKTKTWLGLDEDLKPCIRLVREKKICQSSGYNVSKIPVCAEYN